MRTLWLYLHFKHLQLDSLNELNSDQHTASADGPENPRGELPIVILHAQNNTVMQLNQPAVAAGIQAGMGLGTAAALSQHLQVLPYQPQVEQKKLIEIAEHLYLVTSDICIFPPDGLLLRIHNMLSLYGGLASYWQTLKQQLAQFTLHYHYATGQSPLAARLLARTGWDQINDHYPMLKHQVGLRQLSESELDKKVVDKLNRVGIAQINQLLAIPLKDIAKRFDSQLVTYLGRLSGDFHHPVEFFHPQSKFDRYTELLYEISHSHTLLHPIKHLLTALEHFLKVRDLLTQELHLRLYLRDTDPIELVVGSAQPEYLVTKWLALTELKLESLRLNAPVYALSLTSGKTQLRSPDKTDLFNASKGSLSYLQLISLLQAKLGEQAIWQLEPVDDFRPELANRYSPPAQHRESVALSAQALRPSFLLSRAQPLNEKVTVLHGPERISTGWWDNQPVVRDYFIALNHQQQWLWIYRTPDQKWFVHGLFG